MNAALNVMLWSLLLGLVFVSSVVGWMVYMAMRDLTSAVDKALLELRAYGKTKAMGRTIVVTIEADASQAIEQIELVKTMAEDLALAMDKVAHPVVSTDG
jgi:hypothetical protein